LFDPNSLNKEGATMFSYDISNKELSKEETALFNDYLQNNNIESNIWEVFHCFLKSGTKTTVPLVMRVFDNGQLEGVVFFVKCKKYGKALFNNRLLAKLLDVMAMPCYVWIRSGLCAEVLANPGFFITIANDDLSVSKVIDHMQRQVPFLVVVEREYNSELHSKSVCFPYVNEGMISIENMNSVEDYIKEHKSLRHKINEFEKNGGRLEIIHGPIGEENIEAVTRCQETIAKRSVIYTPFQEIYIDCVKETCRLDSDSIVHIIARSEEKFLGYHTFIQSGDGLYLMHGAFDRNLKTTHKAYENIMIKSVDYALKRNITKIQMGPILNETKNRMMNKKVSNKYYFYSKNFILRKVFVTLFSKSKQQSAELTRFGS